MWVIISIAIVWGLGSFAFRTIIKVEDPVSYIDDKDLLFIAFWPIYMILLLIGKTISPKLYQWLQNNNEN